MKKRSRKQPSRATRAMPAAAHKSGAAGRPGKATISGEDSASGGSSGPRGNAGEREPERPTEIGPDDHDYEGA